MYTQPIRHLAHVIARMDALLAVVVELPGLSTKELALAADRQTNLRQDLDRLWNLGRVRRECIPLDDRDWGGDVGHWNAWFWFPVSHQASSGSHS